tara:strand:+ start:1922 stop:2509 length:588 start_codon:yes stop_codon:yes gene_type:complete
MRSPKSRSRSNKNRNRSVGNIINRVFDSSGPEGKVRGTPQQIIDKYNQLARDSQLSNDRVSTENFQQHAEHYVRLLSEAQREMDARREQQDRENKERNAERDKERQLRSSSDNGAFETSSAAETSTENNAAEAETNGHEIVSEHFDGVDSNNHSAKKNRNNKSRNGRGRRRDENNEKDVSVEVSGEDISSIEAAE